MRNYIKLLSVALLVSGATQVNAADTFAEALYNGGLRSATLNGVNYHKALGIPGLPDGDALKAVQSRLRAYEESIPTVAAPVAVPVPVPAPAGKAAQLEAVGMTKANAAFTAAVFGANASKVVAKITAVKPPADQIQILADMDAAYAGTAAIKTLPAFNRAALSYVITDVLSKSADVEALLEKTAAGAPLTGAFSASGIATTKAEIIATPAAPLAKLVKALYDAEIGLNPAVADKTMLSAAIVTELEDPTLWTTLIAAVK